MRTTLNLDENLVADARELTGIVKLPDLVRRALTELVQREAGRQLALLGGTMPDLQIPPRRRSALPRRGASQSKAA